MQINRGNDDHVHIVIDDELEVLMLRQLLTQVEPLVEPEELTSQDPLASMVGIDTTPTKPTDPAARRLFPDAYRDDDEAATEFRRYTEHDLRHRKYAAVQAIRADLETLQRNRTIDLDPRAARVWLGGLNDIRLVLGTSLGVTEHDDDPGDEHDDDPSDDEPLRLVYHWVTYVQGTLVDALQPRHP